MRTLRRLHAALRRVIGRPLPTCHHCGQPVTGPYHHSLDGPERWHPACYEAVRKLGGAR